MARYQDMDDFMADCGARIRHAAKDTVIRERLGLFGFDEPKLQDYLDLYNETVAVLFRNKDELKDWLAACNAYHNSLHEAQKQFVLIRQLLKFWYAASSPEAVELDLYNDRICTYHQFMGAAEVFYPRLIRTVDALEKLTPLGYTRELIKKQRSNLDQLKLLRENRVKESNQTSLSIEELNSKMDTLADITGKITWMAKLVFQDDEAHYLEKLGIIKTSL